MTSNTTAPRISTEFGRFEIRDARRPASDAVFTLWPIDPETNESSYDGTFRVNGKTYSGTLTAHRSRFDGHVYLSSRVSYNENLTDSARTKLQALVASVAEQFPPLDADTTFDMVLEQIGRRVDSLLEYEIDRKVWEELRGSGLVDSRNSLTITDEQRLAVERRVQAAAAAWLEDRKAAWSL